MIWKLLKRFGLLEEKVSIAHKEEPLREPPEKVQVNFKDPGATADPSGEGKRQRVVEVLNFVDAKTSSLLSARVQDDFRAHTSLQAIIAFLREHGCPRRLSFNHDPRWLSGP